MARAARATAPGRSVDRTRIAHGQEPGRIQAGVLEDVSDPLDETCIRCRYFDGPGHGVTTGLCLRFPQAVHKEQNSWCGEWKQNLCKPGPKPR